MTKNLLFLLAILFLFLGKTFATDIPVASGGDIEAAIAAATDGDIIILEDGGIYKGTLNVTKSLTIKAAEGFKVRPTVISEGLRFGAIASGIHVKVHDLEIISDGGKYFTRLYTPDSLGYLEFKNLVVHGYGRSLIRASDSGQFLDSVLIDGCHFYDFDVTEDTYRLFYIDKGDCPVKYFKAVNSTFEGFDRTFLQLNSPDTKKKIIIDHCTIHGRSDTKDDDLFDLDGPEGSTFTLSNSIISSLKMDKIWDVRSTITDSIMNCMYFDINNVETMLENEWSNETNFTTQDPMYSNGSVGALYLNATSPALTAATDGGAIGDPRWITNPTFASLFKMAASYVDGEDTEAVIFSPSFATDVLDYSVTLPYGVASVNVLAETNFANAAVVGTGDLDVSSGTASTSFVVTAEDASTQTYTVAFTVTPPAEDATLESLIAFNDTDTFNLAPAFDSLTFEYALDVPTGIDTVFFDANLSDNNAGISSTDTVDVSSGTGVGTFVLTAEDGITIQTYNVTIKVLPTGIDFNSQSKIRIYHNSLQNRLSISNSSKVEKLEIYNITGKLFHTMQTQNQESINVSTNDFPTGIYLLRMKLSTNTIQTSKFFK